MQQKQAQECYAIEELQHLLTQSPDNFIIVDVRNPEEYSVGHITNAVNIPITELEQRCKEINQDAIIVTACGKGGGDMHRLLTF